MSGPYVAILSARFRTLLQYRAAAMAGAGTQLFWGLIRVMIFDAFYRAAPGRQPMTFPEVVTYVWLGQALIGILPWNVDAEIRAMIRSGTVAYELLRPADLYGLWYCRAIAARSAPTLLRVGPILLLAGLFFGLQPPVSWASAGGWVLCTLGALLLSAAFSTLLNISLLWTISGEGIVRLAPALVLIFSGMIVPVPLFPAWARPIIDFLPFRGLVDAPFRVYMGHIPPAGAGGAFLHQAAWTLVFALVGKLLLARGTRRLVVQGG